MSRLVHGHGYYEKGKYCSKVNGKHTKEYNLWKGMLERCYNDKCQEKFPTYKDCTVSENFKNFQFFAEWCNKQIGFGREGWEFDKDIIVKGNRVYSEATCAFVPKQINLLLNSRKNCRGKYPIGVSFHKVAKKLRVQVGISGKSTHCGYFHSEDEAFKHYKKVKESQIRGMAIMFLDELDPRVFESLVVWEIKLTD